MRLVGRNGNLLSLVPIRYEFPGAKADKVRRLETRPRTECPEFSGMVDTRAAIPPIERRVTNR